MKKYLPIFFLALLFSGSLHGQDGNDFFSGSQNELYWKNRKPFEGYWQQDVHYTIDAEIDDLQDIISGTETLVYTNNSPDTLTFVYFHLFQNAFQPGSYLDELTLANDVHNKYSRWETEKKGTVVEKIQSDNIDLNAELDNTILKVVLMYPLLPGKSITFNIDFKSYF